MHWFKIVLLSAEVLGIILSLARINGYKPKEVRPLTSAIAMLIHIAFLIGICIYI